MKKITLVSFFTLLLALSFASCLSSSLSDTVEKARAQLPMDLGDGVVWYNLSLEDDCLQMDFNYKEEAFRLDYPDAADYLAKVGENAKESFMKDKDVMVIIKRCVKENQGFRIVMTGTQSGKSATVLELSPEELKAMYPPKK